MDPEKAELLKQIETLEDRIDELFDILTSHTHRGYDQTEKLPTERFELQDAAIIYPNAALANHFYVELAGNRTLANPVNARDGQRLVFELIQDGTGSRTITLGSKFVAGPWTITLTLTADLRDFIECIYNAVEDKFYITNFQKGY